MKCGACLAVCPTYRATGREALVARGRLSLLEAVLDGEQAPTRAFAERISKCIGCRACEAVCPSGLDIVAALDAARADRAAASRSGAAARMAVRRALGGREGRPSRGLRLAAALEQSLYERSPRLGLLPYWRDGARRTFPKLRAPTLMDSLPQVVKPPGHEPGEYVGRVVFYPGCATNIFYPETGLALGRLLARAGIEMVTPRGWRCCGLPFLSLGDRATARELAEDNVGLLTRLLSDSRVDAVVTVCSSCTLALRKDMPALLGAERDDVRALADSVVDIHEYLSGGSLLERIPALATGDGRGRSAATSAGARVAFHNPCHLRWGLGIKSAPAEIIRSIPGVDYSEAPGGGDCCGGGGLFSLHHYDLALKIGMARAAEIATTGAGIIATGCPSCRAQLTDALQRSGSRARVVHTVELLAAGVSEAGLESGGVNAENGV